jgi:glyoxylase-like metal-dependent hydrolase (beta-lactamase superfamily II)
MPNLNLTDHGDGIFAFDAEYLRPGLAAIHLIVQDERAALVDTGSSRSLPNALAALERLGLGPDAVDYVMLTHVHLDHAGGAGAMMARFPNARLVVHPRGARHMIEPSKLLEGVTAVYGAEFVRKVYGEIPPIDAARVIEARDGQSVRLAGRELVCLDTPGHARHHLCFHDRAGGGIFTGDLFGVSLREWDAGGRSFVFPITTPPQFEPDRMRDSLARLLALRPGAVYLAHYSRLGDVEAAAEQLLEHIDALTAVALRHAAAGAERRRLIEADVHVYLRGALRQHGVTLPEAEIARRWKMDVELDAQGLDIWLGNRIGVSP